MKKSVLFIVACIISFCVRAEDTIPQPYESIAKLLYGSNSIASADGGSMPFMLVDTVVLHNYTIYCKNVDVVFAIPQDAPSRTARYLLHNKDSYFLLEHWAGASGIISVTDVSSDECMWEARKDLSTIHGLVYLVRRDYFDLHCSPMSDHKTFPCARRCMKYYRVVLLVCEDFYNQYVRSGKPIHFYKREK